MDTNEMKRILDESCTDLAQTLDDCRNGPAENVRVVEVVEPLLQEFRELQEQVFGVVEPNGRGDNHEQHA